MTPLEFRWDLWLHITRVPALSYGVACVILRLAVLVQCRLVTDRRTDMSQSFVSYRIVWKTTRLHWNCYDMPTETAPLLAMAGGNVSVHVCLFVCLFACWQNNSKSYRWIFLTFGESVDYISEKSWLNFGSGWSFPYLRHMHRSRSSIIFGDSAEYRSGFGFIPQLNSMGKICEIFRGDWSDSMWHTSWNFYSTRGKTYENST